MHRTLLASDAFQDYPSSHRAVVIRDHGGGWTGVSLQTWAVELRGALNLLVITGIADGRTFCWYGPAA
jgi:hypothetical protein